jgi:hypothetical protein
MGQATRTTKLQLDLGERTRGAANTRKRAYLEETAKILDAARAFYMAFFLADPEKLTERVTYVSDRDQQEREGLISPNNHPTLYEGAFALELDETDLRQTFARLKVYTGATW